MKICPVTGRKHRTTRELTVELARIDAQITAMKAAESQWAALADIACSDAVAKAWYVIVDTIDALDRERADVVANPRPMPASAAATYALVKDNID